jgi:enoyl-CoA hydratase
MAMRPLVAVSRAVWDGASCDANGEETAMAERTWVDVRRDARGVAVVTIDNPAKLNTLNTPVMTALIAAVEQLCADETLRAVVLRGAGERAFIGGADIAEMAALDANLARAFITLVHRSCDVFRRLPVPVIARIQGYVFGAGVEVAAACDMRVASADATFGMPEVRLGVPSVVEAALLPQLIGWGRTRQLLLTGDTIDAAKAQAWGLVEDVVPADQLDAAVERMLASILASGPRAIRLQKALITAWEDLPLREAIQRGIDSFAESWRSDEPRQMMGAFAERRRQRKG